jgi:hypothetical protein
MNDPIIEELRQIRDDHSKRFDYDLDAICDDFISHQAQVGSRLVRLKPQAANKSLQPTAQSVARCARNALSGS